MTDTVNPKPRGPLSHLLSRQWLGINFVLIAVATAIFLVVPKNGQLDPDEIIAWIDRFDLSAREKRVPSNAEIIRAISQLGDPNYYSEKQEISLISMASIRFNDEIVQWLLENGANPNPVNGRLPLHGAIATKHPTSERIVSMLLEYGADPNKKDVSPTPGDTALHVAVFWEAAWAIPLLKDYDADISRENALGQTPLEMAKEKGRSDIIELLESLWQ